MANPICIRVANLRKEGYTDLENWINTPNNIYTGRANRIWITNKKTKEKRIFHFKGSKWQNPYKVGGKSGYTLKTSLKKYIDHLFSSGLIFDIEELRGKNLGCFCVQSRNGDVVCHSQVLSELLGRCYPIIQPIIHLKKKLKNINR